MIIYSSHVQIFFYISTNHVCYPFDSFTLSMHLGEAATVSKSVLTSTACFTSLGMEKDVWSANQIWSSHLQVFFLVFMSFRKWKRRLLLYKPVALGWSMVYFLLLLTSLVKCANYKNIIKEIKRLPVFVSFISFTWLCCIWFLAKFSDPRNIKVRHKCKEWTMKREISQRI